MARYSPGESAALTPLAGNAAKAIELVALEQRNSRVEASLEAKR
jgi:hypothetical protein